VIVACGVAAAALIIAEHWLGGPGRVVLGSVLPLALVAGLAGPLAYSLDTAATAHTGALPSAGPATAGAFGGPGGSPGGAAGFGGPGTGAGTGQGGAGSPGMPGGTSGQLPGAGTGAGTSAGTGQAGRLPSGAGRARTDGGPGGLAGSTQVSSATTKLLTGGAAGYRWAAATVGAESAAPFQLASGEPVMAIGGFNGTDKTPTLAQFKAIVAAHEVHYFIAANGNSFGGGSGTSAQITTWVAAHFSQQTVSGVTVYNLAKLVTSS
jgi:hypothetical protein